MVGADWFHLQVLTDENIIILLVRTAVFFHHYNCYIHLIVLLSPFITLKLTINPKCVNEAHSVPLLPYGILFSSLYQK